MKKILIRFAVMTGRRAIMIFCILAVSTTLLSARDGHSQTLDPKKILLSLHVENRPLEEVFRDIEKQTSFRFFYNAGIFDARQAVSLHARGKPLSGILMHLSDETGLEFKQIDNFFSVRPKTFSSAILPALAPMTLPNSLAPAVNPDHALAGRLLDKAIHGKVVDEQGTPLAGVTVMVRGTTLGTVTDASGAFSLTVPEGAVLSISYIGYQPLEISVGDRSELTITLRAASAGLNEIVVTALGIERKKASLGYATQELNGDRLEDAPPTNFVNGLAGKLAGVHITTSGAVGSSARITIRGESSLSMGANQPLFVVDGVPVDNDGVDNTSSADYGNSAAEINPADIASINVLKGPAAAALYGSRAANGAVVITTKKGSNRKGVGVSFQSSYTIEQVARLPRFQNKFGQGKNGVFEGSNFGASWSAYPDGVQDGYDESWGPRLDIGTLKAQFDGPTTNGFRGGDVAVANRGDVEPTPWISHPDNVRDFFRQGSRFSNSIAFAGGNDKGTYRMSLSSLNEKGVIPNNNLDRYQVGLNSSYNLSSKLTSSISFNYTRQNSTNRPENGYGRNTFMYIFTWLGRQVDINSMRDYWQPGLEGLRQFQYNYGENHNNPFFLMYENTNGQQKDHVYGNVALTYDITDHLKLELRTALDHYNDFRPMRRAVSTLEHENGSYQEVGINYEERNSDFLLTYNDALADPAIQFNIALGGNRFDQSGRTQSTMAPELLVPGIYNLGNASAPLVASEYQYKKRINSLYAFGTLNFKDLLYLNITGRNDWSSTLPPGHNAYFYPSVGLSANLKSLLSLPDALSTVRARGSWAQVGNDAGPYQIVNTYGFGSPWGDNYSIVGNATLNNANLKPEITSTYEVGLALGFLQDRLTLDATYYNIRSRNQIINLPLVQSSGESNKVINAGEIRNTGLEFVLNAVPVERPGGLRWSFTLNWSRNVGKVMSLGDELDKIVQAAPGEDASIQARVGERMGAIWGPGYQRVESGDMKGQIIIFPDGSPRPTTEDIYLGNINPDWIGSIYNELSYKNISLHVLFGGQYGGYFISRFYNKAAGAGQLLFSEEGRGARTPGHEYDDPYYIPGAAQLADGKYAENSTTTDGTYSAGVYGTDMRSFIKKRLDHISEAQLFSATYFRLREVSLEYALPGKLLERSFIKGASIALSARNLLLLTPAGNKDFDPEVATATVGNGLVPGFENMSTPPTKGIGVSLHLNF